MYFLCISVPLFGQKDIEIGQCCTFYAKAVSRHKIPQFHLHSFTTVQNVFPHDGCALPSEDVLHSVSTFHHLCQRSKKFKRAVFCSLVSINQFDGL